MRKELSSVVMVSLCLVTIEAFIYYPWHIDETISYDYDYEWDLHFSDLFSSDERRSHLSPIDIESDETWSISLPPLIFSSNHWDPNNFYVLKNTGELADFVQILPRKRLTLSGGPLTSVFKFDSIHSHWHPSSNTQGTEHSVDNQRFAMEFHAIYFNTKYRSIKQAKGKSNGLAVCSFMVQSMMENSPNSDFSNLTIAAEKVTEPHAEVQVHQNVLLPFKRQALSGKYFHYSGTVTGEATDPVKWIVFKGTTQVHPSQVEPFRKMLNHLRQPIYNIREAQTVFNRKVYSVDNSYRDISKKIWNLFM